MNRFTLPVCTQLLALCALTLGVLATAVESVTAASCQNPRDAGARITGRGYAKLSPFRAMRLGEKGGIDVQVDDATWFELVSIEGIASRDLIKRTQAICGGKAWERINEDLVEVLTVLEGDPGTDADITLRDLETGRLVQLANVPMTAEKRQRVKRHFEEPELSIPWTAEAALEELGQVREILDDQFSYRHFGDVDADALFKAAAQRLRTPGTSRLAFARELDKIFRAFGDGHTRVRGSSALVLPGFMPCLVGQTDAGYVAFEESRTGFVDAEHPYLVAIDGLPVEKWLDVARGLASQGAPHRIELESTRLLRNLAELRAHMGREPHDNIELTLRSAAGETTQKELALSMRSRPIFGVWPRPAGHRLLADGAVGYLRIPQMASDDAFLDGLDAAMREYEDTKGLIIDLRGNGGGSRAALRRLFPYFLSERDAPRVVNVAAYRIPASESDRDMPRDGYLDNRWLYPDSWHGWSPEARKAIAKAEKRFRPEWKLRGTFSDWHWMLIAHKDNPKAYHYKAPVIVLIDTSCFSATDIFAGAFKGHTGVTFIGTATGGGSGRSRGHRLPVSGLEFQVSSMASFRPNGKLYERRGIAPDIRMERTADDYLQGRGDTVLERAVERLHD